MCYNKNLLCVTIMSDRSVHNGSLVSPAMPYLEVLLRSEVAVLMLALENPEIDYDTEVSSQKSSQDDTLRGQTFNLNSKHLNVDHIKRIAKALKVPTGADGDEIR